MGLRAKPNNAVKSRRCDGPFLPSVTRRFGYGLSVTVATSDHGRVYVRFPHMPGTDKGRREAQNVRPYHAVVCRRPCPISIGRHRRSGVDQLVPKPVAARANRPAVERPTRALGWRSPSTEPAIRSSFGLFLGLVEEPHADRGRRQAAFGRIAAANFHELALAAAIMQPRGAGFPGSEVAPGSLRPLRPTRRRVP